AAISIAAGGTFNVTAVTPFTLSASTTLNASGTGTTVGTTAAAIAGSSTSLGSRPINLTFAPASPGGDATHPPLYISAGSLSLGGNAFTVYHNLAGTPGTSLGAGTYTLIQTASGTLADGGGETVTVTGNG